MTSHVNAKWRYIKYLRTGFIPDRKLRRMGYMTKKDMLKWLLKQYSSVLIA